MDWIGVWQAEWLGLGMGRVQYDFMNEDNLAMSTSRSCSRAMKKVGDRGLSHTCIPRLFTFSLPTQLSDQKLAHISKFTAPSTPFSAHNFSLQVHDLSSCPAFSPRLYSQLNTSHLTTHPPPSREPDSQPVADHHDRYLVSHRISKLEAMCPPFAAMELVERKVVWELV